MKRTLGFSALFILLLVGLPVSGASSKADILDVHARKELQEPGLLVAASPPVAATATSQVTLELVGQLGGDVKDVVVRDSTAYVGVGPRLVILDISDLANPTRVGERLVVRHGAQRSGAKPHSTALRA